MAKVLIVDDSNAERALLAGIVEARHDVIRGEDGIDAVWHYEQSKPDLVLLDINMPIMGGLEALRLIKEIDPDARVAMLTGERSEQTVLAAHAAGAVDFIAKPYSSARIIEVIDSLLGPPPPSDSPQPFTGFLQDG